MLGTIPQLDQDFCSGTGKFGRHAHFRLTSGTEAGRRIADVEFVHPLESEDEAGALEPFLPGATEALRASREGEESRLRGKRPYTWTPEQGNVNIVISPSPGGAKIYEGAAEVRRATLRNLPNACVLTVFVRLHEVSLDTDAVNRILEFLGEIVDYEMTATRIQGATGTSVSTNGALPFTTAGTIPVATGDLIIGKDDQDIEVVGIAASVNAGGAIIYGTFDKSDDPVEVSLEKIITVHPLTGPLGGTLDTKELAAAGLVATDLLAAITKLSVDGDIKRGPKGWPINKKVIAAAHEAAEVPPAV